MKYPRTYHLPWSPGATKDDRRMSTVSSLLGRQLVITEKMDGSNVCLTHEAVFARSHSGPPKHSSFDALKALHSGIRYLIPKGIQVFGEWLYAKHSIHYTSLPDYLMVFGVREGNYWCSWDGTKGVADSLRVATVPVVCVLSSADERLLKSETQYLANMKSLCGGAREGLVVRPLEVFSDEDFPNLVGKYVRKGHVQTDQHWSHGPIVPNKLNKEEK